MPSYGNTRGYILATVETNHSFNAANASLNPDWQYFSHTKPWVDGIVKNGPNNNGHHITLQANALTSLILPEADDSQLPSMGLLWEMMASRILEQHPYTRVILRAVKVFTFANKPNADSLDDYVCMGYEVEAPPIIYDLRKALHREFPDLNEFPSWVPHVTVGYFHPKHENEIRNILEWYMPSVLMKVNQIIFSVKKI